MIPVNEGNDACWKCEHYDCSNGCIPTCCDKLPPCGRNVIVAQSYLRELMKKSERRQKLWEARNF